MKKLRLLGAAAAALMCAAPAMAADTATNNIGISGTSPNTCTLNSGAQTAATNAAFTPGSGSSTLAITALASAADASLQATSATLTFVGMCNYKHNVGLKSANSGLQNANTSNDPVAGSGSFIKKVGYTASYTWAGHSSSGSENLTFTNNVGTGASAAASTTTGATFAVAGANQGNLVLQLDVAASATPVVAGTYSDTLTVQIGAAL
ncbi:MAG: hypothetical protein JO167_07245 [Alphaproteobacteria bacterium]|nr:hypothetical protein [Alphaproteobacteria bacterium]MBV9904102.1 hypothetical protein [Alphaproteobacteria bacterium]